MQQFKDTQGRDWQIDINVASLRRVQSVLKTDLLKVLEDRKLLERLYGDPMFLVDVLCVLLKPQCEKHGITDEQFAEAMAGDCIEAAAVALIEDLIGFSPSQKDRANLLAVWKATHSGMERARQVVATKLGSEMPRIVDAAVETATSSLISALGSSGSTPDPTP